MQIPEFTILSMPDVDISVLVMGFLRAMEHLGEDDVVESTQQWMKEFQQNMEARRRAFAAAWADFLRLQGEINQALAQSGWVGIELHFTDAHALKALEIKKTEGEAAMNEFIADYFNADQCAELFTMTKAWSKIPYLRDRESVITDSLWAHREGRFTLSVPALLPLAEGLAAEIAGSVPGNVVKAVAQDWKQREALTRASALEPEMWAEIFAHVVDQVIYKYYDFAKDPAPHLSRNGILHGRVPDYGSKVNSVRVFLLVNVIANLWLQKQQKALSATRP
jgi:hypothetical protein